MSVKRFTAIHPVKGIRQQCLPAGNGYLKFADGTTRKSSELVGVLPVKE